MTPQEIDRIESAIRYIQTAVDVDEWAAEIAVESMRKRITPTSVIVENRWMTKNDIAIHLINEIRNIILKNDSWTEDATTAVNEATDMAIKALESQKHTCQTCARSSDNCEHTTTRCPIEEHYALPKDGYCHLWKEIKNDER